MLLQRQSMTVFADYHQFYLWDAGMNPQAPEDYSADDIPRRIKTGPYVVVIQPERNMPIPFDIEVHDSEPSYTVEAWDHIAEASLHLPTGKLQVEGCMEGPVADLSVEPGWYRIRSFHGGFDTIAEVGTDGEDYYLAQLWPALPGEVTVVKQGPLFFAGD
jgi:hypothetical protein